MKDFYTLLKLGLKSELDSITVGDKAQGKISSGIILFIIFTLSIEIILYKSYFLLKTVNMEVYIIQYISIIEFCIISGYMLLRVTTNVFLSNKWKKVCSVSY